jgi:hypothetical protein
LVSAGVALRMESMTFSEIPSVARDRYRYEAVINVPGFDLTLLEGAASNSSFLTLVREWQ